MMHTSTRQSNVMKAEADFIRRLSLYCALLALVAFIPSSAYAAASDPLSATICVVVNWFTGGLGRAIATLGIIVLGIGAMMGKVSWQMALTVAVGISIMFSGAQVVALLTKNAAAANLCTGITNDGAGMMEDVLCNLASWSRGTTGRAMGTLAVIFLGITALMGKVSPAVGLLLVAGLGMLFGADRLGEMLVESLTGGTWMGCSPTVTDVVFT